MISVNYYNTETGQKMEITMKPDDEGTASISIDFDPVIKDGTKDPHSLMTNIMELFGFDGS